METIEIPVEVDLTPNENDGPYCSWRGPMPEAWVHARSATQRTDELVREGMASLYDLHAMNAQQIYGAMEIGYGGWGPMAVERDKLRDAAKRDQGSQQYGSTFDYAHRVWHHTVMEPVAMTENEARERNEDEPNPCPKCIAKGEPEKCKNTIWKAGTRMWQGKGVIGTLDELQTSWIDRYIGRVKQILEREEDGERRIQFSRLKGRLASFKVGTAEGIKVTERLEREAKGREVLRLLSECQGRLLERIDQLGKELVPTEFTTDPAPEVQERREKLKWNGSLQMLARVIDQHAEKGYITRPQTHGENSTEKLARMLLEVFDVDNGKGKSATVGSLRKALSGDVSEQVKKYTVRDLSDFEEPRRPLTSGGGPEVK